MKVIFSISLIFVFATIGFAQKITLKPIVVEGSDIVIRYDFEAPKGKAYFISLFGSHDNYFNPLRATGDVQEKRVLSGSNKVIRWNSEDLVQFDGEISFKLAFEPAPPLFTDIRTSTSKVKKGRPLTITWTSEIAEAVKVELVNGTKKISAGSSTTGKINFLVPKKVKTGKYTVTLSGQQEITTGDEVFVKPVIPGFLKVALLAGAAGAVFIFTSSGSDSGGANTSETLPKPPNLDN